MVSPLIRGCLFQIRRDLITTDFTVKSPLLEEAL